jgi:hypothetical protein
MGDEALMILNLLAYAAAASGVAVLVRSPSKVRERTFRELGDVLRGRFPELPEGFTLREGLARARQVAPLLDWGEIYRALDDYEGYRYGGFPEPNSQQPALVGLVAALRGASS